MKIQDLHDIADRTFELLRAAEEAESELRHARGLALDAAVRVLLSRLLRRVLPLFSMEEIERLAVEGAVEVHGGKAQAAEALGISRRSIYNKTCDRAA
ncbi:MAG: hypothetical protein HY369_00470 [Candidatus Aenigmarchaeota archaeon]|nr:hypothetical protein [Candidatus Aenigmarchaeota archaeon]